MMRRVLVTAGGTATAWHIASVVEKYFHDTLEVHICDTNPAYLVPASTLAKKAHKVPAIIESGYTDAIARIVEKEKIDSVIPLIPQEAYIFASDGEFVKRFNLESAAPTIEATNLLADKTKMYKTLSALDIPTPRVYSRTEIDESKYYLLKPRLGFGSAGVEIIKGELIKEENERIIQEYCHDGDYDEVTVEIYNGSAGLHVFSRRRIATKAGVCVKMEPVDQSPFLPYVKKLVDNVNCPKAFNVQFLWNNGEWKLFDCNLRLGAGTALSSAIGFQLTRALLAELAGDNVEETWFTIDNQVKAVLRVYQEIVVK